MPTSVSSSRNRVSASHCRGQLASRYSSKLTSSGRPAHTSHFCAMHAFQPDCRRLINAPHKGQSADQSVTSTCTDAGHALAYNTPRHKGHILASSKVCKDATCSYDMLFSVRTWVSIAVVAKSVHPRRVRESRGISVHMPGVAVTVHCGIADKLVAVH